MKLNLESLYSNNRFMPSVFFEGLNLNIPSHFTQKLDRRETIEAIRNSLDIEENDKIFLSVHGTMLPEGTLPNAIMKN